MDQSYRWKRTNQIEGQDKVRPGRQVDPRCRSIWAWVGSQDVLTREKMQLDQRSIHVDLGKRLRPIGLGKRLR